MDAMRADADFMEVSAKEDIKVPVFVSGSDFPLWMDETRNALGARMVVTGIPLYHITRPEVVPAAFANPSKQLMYEAALSGPNFICDNATVFSFLLSSMDKKGQTNWHCPHQAFRTRAEREGCVARLGTPLWCRWGAEEASRNGEDDNQEFLLSR